MPVMLACLTCGVIQELHRTVCGHSTQEVLDLLVHAIPDQHPCCRCTTHTSITTASVPIQLWSPITQRNEIES
jgi:hypothetical protein